MQKLISLENIVKNYRHMRALNDVTLDIKPGITGLLGPNGAGKSTLIKVILGLVKVNSGTGEVLGYRLGRQGRSIRDRVGYMPEDDCYIAGMTGIEVVQFSASLAGLPIVEGLRRAHEILDFCGMKQERYRTIETYSTGMRQKVKFAAAIVHDPDFLIFDEPTSGLDPEERENLLNRILILARDANKSVLISTHILPDVQTICDHALILAAGQVRLSESLKTLNSQTKPTVTVNLVGDPTKFEAEIQHLGMTSERHADGSVRVSSNTPEFTSILWQASKSSDTAIQSITPAKNDLESIFVQAVEEAEVANL